MAKNQSACNPQQYNAFLDLEIAVFPLKNSSNPSTTTTLQRIQNQFEMKTNDYYAQVKLDSWVSEIGRISENQARVYIDR